MKRVLLLSMLPLLLLGNLHAQQGKNSFTTQFNKDATTLDKNNALLLGYLSTMVYADYLRFLYSPVHTEESSFVKTLKDDSEKFVTEYAKKLAYLFTDAPAFTPLVTTAANRAVINSGISSKSPQLITAKEPLKAVATEPAVTFDFINKCNPNGYDPEAILISTPTVIYVVFRGTDRVSCNVSKAGYQFAEWLASDFKFLKRDASFLHAGIRGQVHRGMAESLKEQNFADELGAAIAAVHKNKVTGATKKVWITGHSLGGGHAQLFTLFLKYNYNITAQGLYLYDAPHPGDATFAAQLNTDIGKSRIQRFEFGDDPIPTLPPQAFQYGRSGTRNYYKDHNSTVQVGEQTLLDDAKILCALGNLPTTVIPQLARFEFPPYCPGSLCFHHPTFLLKAIRHQLSSSVFPSLPPDVPLPVAGQNCNQGALTKAADNNLLNNTATAIENTLAQISFSVGNIAGNLTGSVPEGRYKLVCYAFKNNAKKYLKWNNTLNSQLQVSTTGTVFNLVHKLTGGYQLFADEGNMAANVKFFAGAPTGEEINNNVIMRPKDIVIGDEETWYLFKLPNTVNTFVFYNWNTKKVLDAPDNCLTSGSCGVNEFTAKDNTPTQVWMLEKVN